MLDFLPRNWYNQLVFHGDVPKWLKGADSKSARRRKACGGSNPSISANKKTTRWGGFLIDEIEKRNLNRSQMKYASGIFLPPVQELVATSSLMNN